VPLLVTQNARALGEIEPEGLFYASRTEVRFRPMRFVLKFR